jgi:predicted 3-demethylubiquinone-9 3-methyltransferase (glyoxalase superfamily)
MSFRRRVVICDMPKLINFLWFDTQAEAAAELYTSVFPNSRIVHIAHYTEANPSQADTVMTVDFELDGVPFTALNGGPQFTFDEAISFMIECESQDEIEYYTDKLTADGGEQGPCGWVKDRFGMSWQVTPRRLKELVSGDDRETAQRVMAAMMQMRKLDIAALEAAARTPA